jgi:hypothetical protein
MKRKRRRDPDRPVGKLTIIPNFLPPPEELFPMEETVKVTLVLDKESVLFFKKRAQKSGMKYQRMMRHVLKGYVRHYNR